MHAALSQLDMMASFFPQDPPLPGEQILGVVHMYVWRTLARKAAGTAIEEST